MDSSAGVVSMGSVFAGRYRIVRPLGEGDRKRTYLAEDTVVPRQVALALIKPTAAHLDPSGSRREAEALGLAGTNDYVVTFHDWGVVEGTEYLVFDYLAGGTLRDYLAKRFSRDKPLSVEDVMRLGRQLARALAHVHRLGLIHRDLAPGNVWLDERQVAHLGDFDSAVSLASASDPAGLPPTTEAYAAPEQLAGDPFDQRSDLYSLGAVLFESLTGERPARGPAQANAVRLRTLRHDCPRGLIQTICKLLAEPVDDRPSSADEVLESLKPRQVSHDATAGLIAWADTLPFPLASILWHFEGEPDAANKIDYLLKFFEALAQFIATVEFSACVGDRPMLDASYSQLLATSKQQKPLELPTFGTWAALSACLSKNIRTLLQDETGEQRCSDLFETAETELIDALTSAELTGILRRVVQCRNSWSGHGGVAGPQLRQQRLGELASMLTDTRALLGWAFEAWTLIKPGPMVLSRGTFELTATILTGPNPAFRRKQLRLTEALDATRLYLHNDGQPRALELVPFIRILAGKTDQDACYFYNRMEGAQARWVSYHFHADPELHFFDEELATMLDTLPGPR
jgi:serine/threonine protein kinase